ncbi:Invasion protein B, involved in pathogenesis [Hartmannibacter diazotrophicus]|uniref:Invasion protein B, involved in pathogenesis n=1 Tax=Hartmannibacter diazotrophicus TaxID=1482074 RepID=A0A2C9D6F5_9HYPH|nr:invasion associated locus B family protein [Hartmannibacter diazotrophicus]SON55904.1 Invasion protein B, involved in pathogenesis [Hartmannibacter diazotrophicus]
MTRMNYRIALLLAAIGCAMPFGGALPAFAQDAAAPASDNATPGDVTNSWIKVCGEDKASKKVICFIQRELRTETGQFLATAGVREVKDEGRKILLMQVPPGMLIQPGLRVQIDKNKQDAAKYTICFPNACFAELAIDDAFITSMKKGNSLVLTTLNQQGKGVSFPLSLSGFTAAYDGDPLDTAALQEQQKKLQDELQRKAKEAQQKLIDAQKQANEPAN